MSVISYSGVVMVTFDEIAGSSPNRVYIAISGRAATNVRMRDGTALISFSVLKTMENFRLKLRTVYLEDSTQFLSQEFISSYLQNPEKVFSRSLPIGTQ